MCHLNDNSRNHPKSDFEQIDSFFSSYCAEIEKDES